MRQETIKFQENSHLLREEIKKTIRKRNLLIQASSDPHHYKMQCFENMMREFQLEIKEKMDSMAKQQINWTYKNG